MKKLLFLILLLNSGCQNIARDYIQGRVLNHAAKLESFQGTMKEQWDEGKLTQESEVFYRRPKIYSEVKSPGPLKGSWLRYNGERITIYHPKTNFAVDFKNVDLVTNEDIQAMIKDRFNKDMDTYQFKLGRTALRSGYDSIGMSFTAKNKDSFIKSGQTFVYDDLAFPMFHKVDFKDGQSYSHNFENIKFNVPIPEDKFKFTLPANAIMSEWDLKSKNYSLKEATDESGLQLKSPKVLFRGLKLDKIIRQKGLVPAFNFIYKSKPYFMYVAVVKDMKAKFIPQGPAVTIKSRDQGQMLFFSNIVTCTFILDDAIYTVTSNLPAEELIEVINSI